MLSFVFLIIICDLFIVIYYLNTKYLMKITRMLKNQYFRLEITNSNCSITKTFFPKINFGF